MSEDEAVLFIHSTGTKPSLWKTVPDSAIGSRRRFSPSNIGYPPGEPIPRGRVVTVEEETAHVLAAVPSDVRRVHLVGHSYGGLVALHAVESLRDRLASMFLFEPVVFGSLARETDADPEAFAQARRFVEHPWFLTDSERGGREEWLETFVDYWNHPGSWSKLHPQTRALAVAMGWKMFQEVRACFVDGRPISAWSLPAPTTIAFGDGTTVASRAMSIALAHDRANARLIELHGVGHMAPLTHQARVHAEIEEHFSRMDENA